MKKIILCIITLSTLLALEEAAYLKIEPSVRIASMGETGVAIASGVQDVFLNPASLSRVKHMSLSANYMNWYTGIGYGLFGIAFRKADKEKISQNSFAFSVIGVNVEGMEKRNEDGELLGMFGSSSYVFTFSYSRILFKGIAGGFNVKYLYDNIAGDVAYGYAIDMGFIYWIQNMIGFGFSVRNLGPGLSGGSKDVLSRTDFALPMEVRAGGSYLYNTGIGNLAFNADLILSLTGNPGAIGVSFEYDIMKNLYLRAGLKKALADKILKDGAYTTVSENTFSFGIGFGLRYGNMSIDYAFYSRNDFIKPHRLGVSINF